MPSREKASGENPQIFPACKYKIIFPLKMREANAAHIQNRLVTKKAAAQKSAQLPFAFAMAVPY